MDTTTEPLDLVSSRNVPTEELETWQVEVPGLIRLTVLKTNRFGHFVEEPLQLGPNRAGYRFRISTEDRRENQRYAVTKEADPFRNGMLIRIDTDQQSDPDTASTDALSDEQLLDVLDLPEGEFETRVAELGEIPTRKLLTMATGAGASHNRVTWLQAHVRETYRVGGPQTSIEDDGEAETLTR